MYNYGDTVISIKTVVKPVTIRVSDRLSINAGTAQNKVFNHVSIRVPLSLLHEPSKYKASQKVHYQFVTKSFEVIGLFIFHPYPTLLPIIVTMYALWYSI